MSERYFSYRVLLFTRDSATADCAATRLKDSATASCYSLASRTVRWPPLRLLRNAADQVLLDLWGPEGRDKLWTKSKLSWMHIYEHYRDKAEWFVKADDDTCANPLLAILGGGGGGDGESGDGHWRWLSLLSWRWLQKSISDTFRTFCLRSCANCVFLCHIPHY